MHAQRPCYPGTTIPLIRGGAPDSPTPGATPNAAPASDSTSSAGAATITEPLKTVTDDLQARYDALEARHKAWSEFGDDPGKIRDVVRWAQERAADIQAGRLRAYDPASERKPETTTPADPYEGFEDLTPREQAAALRRIVAQDLSGSLTKEAQQLKTMLEEHQRVLSTQSTLFQKAMRLAVKHPEVPFEELVAKAQELGSAGSDQLFDLALENILSPAKQKAVIEQEVQKRLAAKQQEEEAAEAASFAARQGPRLVLKDPATRAERAQKSRLDLERAVHKAMRERESKAS